VINFFNMMKDLILKQKGSVSGFLVLGVLLVAISMPMAVFLTQKKQETRSSAAGDLETVGVCGRSTGEYFTVRPDSGLCDGGVLIWTDEKADDGDWNWVCEGDPSVADSSVECIAAKSEE